MILGQDVFCDCGLDILEYRVKEIRTSNEGTFYILQSKKGVGRHRCLEIIVYRNGEGTIRYFGLNGTDDSEYGLEPFTEGHYFTTLGEAKNSFAQTQIALIDEDTKKLSERINTNNVRRERWTKMLISQETANA
jgi:hypothetical protein